MTQQPERDALEAAARAIHDRYEAMTHWVKTLKNEPRQFEESSIRDVHRQDAQVAINAYLAALSAQGMRVIQESELKSAEGALFNLPANFERPGYLLYQITHGKPITTGYVTRDNPRTIRERAPVFSQFW